MSKNEKYAVDGYFFTQRVSGIQRYSIELLAEADKLLEPGELEIVVPPNTETPSYKNIRVVEYVDFNGRGGIGWEQFCFPRYLAQNGRRWLCTCNVIPLWAAGCEGIAVLHDICYRVRPDFYTDVRGRVSAAWHKLQYSAIAAKAQHIITVSNFSKSEIVDNYPVAPEKISVIYNAWQQMQRIAPDEAVFAGTGKWPQLKKGEYYFSMANLQKNKNFPWVLRAAQKAPQSVFAIAGSGSLAKQAEALGLAGLPNVVYLGYVTDGEAKTLMANCKAFLFPTLYEGFGIPPLEAIACGAPCVLVSNTPCMQEVYGPYASYIDLAVNSGDVNFVIPGAESENAAGLLDRYSWTNSAARLVALLRGEQLPEVSWIHSR